MNMTILKCPDCGSTNIRQPNRKGDMPPVFDCYDCGLHAENRIWSKKEK